MPVVRIGSTEISYSDEGTGTPIVLRHSGGSNRRQWRKLTEHLRQSHRVLAPDLYGHGDTGAWTGRTPPLLADFAAIISAIAAQIGERLHLIGHSHGGAVALAFAEAAPERVRSLVLMEPTMMHLLRVAGRLEAWAEADDLGHEHMDHVARGELEACADMFLPYWIGQVAWEAMPQDRRQAIVASMPAVAHFWSSVLGETKGLDRYARIGAPTLLVRGARTRRPAREIVDLLAEILPNNALVEIEGAGHMSPLTHSEAVNAAIVSHLN